MTTEELKEKAREALLDWIYSIFGREIPAVTIRRDVDDAIESIQKSMNIALMIQADTEGRN